MNENKINLIFEGPLINDHGVPLDDLFNTVSYLQRAIRMLIREYEGIDTTHGRPPQIVAEQSTLLLVGTTRGSVNTEWELAPPVGVQSHLNRSGLRALQTILHQDDTLGDGKSNLSPAVQAELDKIANDLSADVSLVRMESPINDRSIEFRRTPKSRSVKPDHPEDVEARLGGRLLEVNWDRGTAQLHRYAEKYIRLTFRPDLGEEMRRLATQYVEITGRGTIDETDQWKQIEVIRIDATHSWAEPFDLEAVLQDSDQKIFCRDDTVIASEPFDVGEFNRLIREGRQDA